MLSFHVEAKQLWNPGTFSRTISGKVWLTTIKCAHVQYAEWAHSLDYMGAFV